MSPSHRRPSLASLLVLGLLAALVPLLAPAPAAAEPVVTGEPCAPGVGVTVVVDLQALGGVEIGCAPGAQADGFAALTAAGFTYNDDGTPVGGTICQIEDQPAAGYPTCWNDGFWGYWKSDGTQPWAWSNVGVGSGPIAIDSVEGWSWTAPIPEDYSGLPIRVAVDELSARDCTTGPVLPDLGIIDGRDVLPVSQADGAPVEVAVLPADAPIETATYAETTSVDLGSHVGQSVRVLARVAGDTCAAAPTFDATYDVRATYPGRGAPFAVPATSPDILAWPTAFEDYLPGTNVSASFKNPQSVVGQRGLVVLGDHGTIDLVFDPPIADGAGADVVVFENGFIVGAAANGLDFLELGRVAVSSDGEHWATFDSASRRATTVGAFAGQRADEIGGLAGRELANTGTPFDLTDLRNQPEVRAGAVDLDHISRVRIIDVVGDGSDLDSFGRPIYEPFPTTGSGGFDLTGVAALHQAPPPCSAPGAGGEAAAIAWLGCELEAADGVFGSIFDDVFYPDAGLTMDTLLAFALTGHADDPRVAQSLAALAPSIPAYVQGFGAPEDRTAGPTAKTLLTSILAAGDAGYYDGIDLEADLRSLMQTTGPQAGRFTDISMWGDTSNGFGQTLAIMALSRTTGGVPAASIEFLLDQQCPSGGFRGAYSGPVGCESDDQADTDYSAFALQALLTSPGVPGVGGAIDDVVTWLHTKQDPETGAFGGTGFTAGLNTNSSGLIAQALRAAGDPTTADEAAAWVADQQITGANAGTGPATADLGAIAYDPEGLTAALTDGIGDFTRDQFRRSTPQAVLAFTAGPFGVIGEAPEPVAVIGDHDGDGRTDLSIFRASTGRWYVRGANSVGFGAADDIPVPADYDGDGAVDIATFRPSNGRWFVRGQAASIPFGTAGDLPVPGQWDEDPEADIAVYRPSTGRWYVQGVAASVQWGGVVGDIPVPADYDGDGTVDIAVFRSTTGRWWFHGHPTTVAFGTAGDVPVPGQWDGDPEADIAVYRPSTGRWYVQGQAASTQWGGLTGDVPVPGQYDDDPELDIAVYRPTNGNWYQHDTAITTQWGGVPGDVPVVLPAHLRLIG